MITYRRYLLIQQGIKRLIDLLICVIGLIFLSPVLLLIAIAIRLDSPGNAIYSHSRVGKGGRTFNLYKFRSMTSGGDDTGYLQYLQQLIESELGGGENALPYRKMEGDPRITRVGAILRRFYLDELPQLWNVVKGEMSLVGPRPHIQVEVEYYSPEQSRRLSVKPGLTGLWQVIGKGDSTFCELIQLDLDYIDHWSLKFDIQIIFSTLMLMFRGGESVWARKAKEIPGKVQEDQTLPVPTVIFFESSKQEEIDWMLVDD